LDSARFEAVTAGFLRTRIVWDMTLQVGDLFPPFRRDEAESWLTQPVSHQQLTLMWYVPSSHRCVCNSNLLDAYVKHFWLNLIVTQRAYRADRKCVCVCVCVLVSCLWEWELRCGSHERSSAAVLASACFMNWKVKVFTVV
jgi:hypothetical protein